MKQLQSYPASILSMGPCFNMVKKSGRIGEAAMFGEQLAGPAKMPMGMNQPSAAQNPQLLLNIIHWLDGKL